MSSYRKIPTPKWMDDDLSRLDPLDGLKGRRPSAPYPAEPTHGAEILKSDRLARVARRNHLHELEVWSLVILIAALCGAAAVLGAGLLSWWLA